MHPEAIADTDYIDTGYKIFNFSTVSIQRVHVPPFRFNTVAQHRHLETDAEDNPELGDSPNMPPPPVNPLT